MLCKQHYEKMIAKLSRFEETLNPYLFEKVESIPVKAYVADKQYHTIPENVPYEEISEGWRWGGEGAYCWLRTQYTVPEALSGRDIFIMPKMGGYEAMLFVNGVPFGTFNTKIVYTSHGNHYCDLLRKNAVAGEKIDIAIEYYAGHDYHGCDPFSRDLKQVNTYDFSFDSLDICLKNDDIVKFYFDLKTVVQLATELPDTSYMKAQAINALTEAHKVLYYSPEDVTGEEFFSAIAKAQPYLTKVLSLKNGDAAPFAGLIGHSHMDTAWLWHVGETVKKCARTYANQISLMEQYPEHRFVQSSSCHSDMVRKYYPAVFERIKEKVSEGRYEPNGAVWVECDCNITSGESMIRQFLWGQRFTDKYFSYRSDAFWLPDTFGYSASIPQIMKGCGVDYFLTTKINWNDTNAFPYNTFLWEGIDGTRVFSHFNTTHSWPDVKELRECLTDGDRRKDQPTVTDKRLMAYGYGDGGGGPQFEMIEAARRVEDLYDVPRTRHTTVSAFMKELEETAVNPNIYRGELYLELHRGTLTNQHEIKYNNRKAELALRDLEFLKVCEAMKKDTACSTEETNKLYETVLLNQFHDILPGTCINRAHEECKAQMRDVIKSARAEIKSLTDSEGEGISVTNSLSFERSDVIFAEDKGKSLSDVLQQTYEDIDGRKLRLIGGVTVPALSSVRLAYGKGRGSEVNPFTYDGDTLTTPFAKVTFDKDGYISSFIDTVADRELVNGKPFNTLIMAEDVPMSWDNWDVDADLEMKFAPCGELLERAVVSDGDVAFIIRSKYRISRKSTLTQDMIFFACSPEVRFDTRMDWQDDHRFLKTVFDTDVREEFARHEIQFGYCKRPTTRNNSLEQAKFEVVNHKYTDLSEPNYGVTLMNDCKYGISVNGSQIALSLHKGGNHPDVKGDKGLHSAVYSFMPHNCSFGADAVIRPAYMLNLPHIVSEGVFELSTLVSTDKTNIIVEAIKPCEDEQRAFIVRIYEAEGTKTNCTVAFSDSVKKLEYVNMLEENPEEAAEGNVIKTQFRPFEIKTVKAYY